MKRPTYFLAVKAEVFKVIRANVDSSPAKIFREIKKHLPEATQHMINEALRELHEASD